MQSKLQSVDCILEMHDARVSIVSQCSQFRLNAKVERKKHKDVEIHLCKFSEQMNLPSHCLASALLWVLNQGQTTSHNCECEGSCFVRSLKECMLCA